MCMSFLVVAMEVTVVEGVKKWVYEAGVSRVRCSNLYLTPERQTPHSEPGN